MATTLSLQSSINFAQSYGGFKQLTIGTANEPAVTSGNIILNTVLSPPFCWNWNRNSVSFLTTASIQDYLQSVSSFGFIEKASYVMAAQVTGTLLTSNQAVYTAANQFVVGDLVTVTGTSNGNGIFNVVNQSIVATDGATFTVNVTAGNISFTPDSGVATSGDVSEIPNVQNVLGSGNESGTPNFISPQLDDNRGNITFRILPIPDQVFQINVIFQKKLPALMTGPTSTWAPIPDHYSNIYQWGFLAVVAAYFNDPRWAQFSQKFVACLLGMAEGLDQDQKNIFEKAWLDMVSERQTTNLKSGQGVQARGGI